MKSPSKSISTVTRPNASEIQDTVRTSVSFLHENDSIIYLDKLSVEEHCIYTQDSTYREIINKTRPGRYCDLVVVLDGGGIFLLVAYRVAPCVVPTIGINQGYLGFLAQISCDTVAGGIRSVLEGRYPLEERIPIEASIIRDGETTEYALTLDDIVLPRGGIGQMVEFEVFINQEFIYTRRLDGLIISTPTGSAAYTLATDGLIMQVGLHALTLVPVCPQSMTNRPIVIPDISVIEILITRNGDARARFGGQSHVDV